MNEHKWSGWPGAICLNCGVPDLTEEGLADCQDCVWNQTPEDHPCEKHTNKPCPIGS